MPTINENISDITNEFNLLNNIANNGDKTASVESILSGTNLNLLAVAVADILAAHLTENERSLLSLFFANLSISLQNIAFMDQLKRQTAAKTAIITNNAAITSSQQ